MIKFIEKEYSTSDSVIQEIEKKFEKEKEYNYDISDSGIPSKDYVSVTSDLSKVEIYLPEDFDYLQYDIDDFIMDILPYSYTDSRDEGKFRKITVKSRLTSQQYYKLLKFLIKEGEFCVILK